MKYLLIENQGICPLEGFTILGLSASRNNEEKIGEFGSGNKHAINVLLRHSLSPTIYLGTQKLTFETKEDTFEGESYSKVFYRLGNKRPVETGFCLEFGIRDWQDVHMGLREIVSNAIDRAGVESVNIEVVDKMRARSGYTRAYIPYSDDVKNFHQNLNTYFLHFSGRQDEKILEKIDASPAKIYRKGVFVREINSRHGPALFDHNFGDEFRIDEARNASDYVVTYLAAKAISADQKALTKIFNCIKNNEMHYWEFKLPEFDLKLKAPYVGSLWKETWQSIFGNMTVTRDDYVHEMARRKGWNSILLDSHWTNVLIEYGITDTASRFTEVETKGYEIIEPTFNARHNLDIVWNWMVELGITNGKEKPALYCFSGVVEGSSVIFGYYSDNSVYINTDHDDSLQCMIEEVAHHITGSTDLSRDFQEFAFQVAAKLMKKIGTAA